VAWSGAPPGDSLVGDWSSPYLGRDDVHVQPTGDSTLIITAPGMFVAHCFLDGTSLIGMARLQASGSLARRNGGRFAMIRATWSNSTALNVTWSSLATGKAIAEETWSFGPRSSSGARNVVIATGSDSLPKFGDYVYVEELPEAMTKAFPAYPDEARKNGIDGLVMVQALVGTDGRVKDVKVVKSIPMLDEAALACVRQWRFKPALSHGNPVAVWVGVPVKFSLH
jgi:protein TonB